MKNTIMVSKWRCGTLQNKLTTATISNNGKRPGMLQAPRVHSCCFFVCAGPIGVRVCSLLGYEF